MHRPLKQSSQCAMILGDLMDGFSVTPAVAADTYSCYALSQRIGELKRRGHRILAEITESKYARYYMLSCDIETSRKIEGWKN